MSRNIHVASRLLLRPRREVTLKMLTKQALYGLKVAWSALLLLPPKSVHLSPLAKAYSCEGR